MRGKHQFLPGLAASFLTLALPVLCQAATITVNSLADPGDPGICALRDAITAANTGTAVNGCDAGTGDDTIVFSVTGIITLGSTLPAIANTVTIQGPAVSPPAITLEGEFHGVITVNSGATLNLNNLGVADGFSPSPFGAAVTNEGRLNVINSLFAGNTGAIFSEGSLEVINSTFSSNSCDFNCAAVRSSSPQTVTVTNSLFEHNGGNDGGGAISADSLTVTNSIFTDNNADLAGGAISAGTLTVRNTTFNDNSAFCPPINCTPSAFGGAIDANSVTVSNSTFDGNSAGLGGAISAGSATVTNSTFIGNSATGVSLPIPFSKAGLGGAIFSGGPIAVTNSTFSANSAEAGGGGGIFDDAGTLAVTNSTFNGNAGGGIVNGSAFGSPIGSVDIKGTILTVSTGDNCVGPITDVGYNLDDDGSCDFSSSTTPDSAIALDPNGLQNNSGPTETSALESNSVAINKIPVANCTDQSSPPVRLLTDQRGVIRPQFTACDIGAYEYDTALSLKSNVLNAINGTTGGNSADGRALNIAASNLAQAVRFYFSGTSGNELNPVAGILNFLAEERAVNALSGTLIPSSQLPPATIENYLFNITLADRTLAVVAIADVGGNAEASQLVATGDAQEAAGDHLDAVISYQKAWSLAVS
jgi:hypothetical protein